MISQHTLRDAIFISETNNANYIASNGIMAPSSTSITEVELIRVCETIKDFLKNRN